jgi:hypothetical protein
MVFPMYCIMKMDFVDNWTVAQLVESLVERGVDRLGFAS